MPFRPDVDFDDQPPAESEMAPYGDSRVDQAAKRELDADRDQQADREREYEVHG